MSKLSRFLASGAPEPGSAATIYTGDELPPPPPLSTRADWILALAVSAVFAIVYLCTSSLWAFPGSSADLTCVVTGAVPLPTPSNQALVAFLRLFVPLGGARAATIAAIFVSSFTLGAVFLFAKGAFQALMDGAYVREAVEDGAYHAAALPRLGGIVAAVALALSPPFWIASTRVESYAFYLLPLVVAAWLLMRGAAEDRLGLSVWALGLYGALCTQSVTAIQFLPAMAVLWLYGALVSRRPAWIGLLVPPLAFLTAFVLSAWLCVTAFKNGPGYELMNYDGSIWVLVRFVQPLLGGSIAAMTRPHWLIIGCMTVLPFFACVLVGRFSLSSPDRSPAVVAMNLAIFAATLMVLFGSRYSPWGLLGFQPEQVTAYALSAISFAYCVVVALLQILFFNSTLPTEREESLGSDGDADSTSVPSSTPAPTAAPAAAPTPAPAPAPADADDDVDIGGDATAPSGGYHPVLSKFLRGVVLALCALVLFRIGAFGLDEADASASKFLRTYVDAVLGSMNGRDIVVTDSLFSSVYRLRARELDLPLEILDLSEASGSATRKLFRRSLEDPALENALDLGAFSFLQEFIGNSTNAGKRVALTWFPDLWNLGPWRIYPRGLVFLGAPESAPRLNPLSEPGPDPIMANLAAYTEFISGIGPDLDRADLSANRATVALSKTVRRRLSFVGNNLAWYLDGAGRDADALALWRMVHQFDPENISAMLNLFTALRDKHMEEERESVRKELDEFRAQLRRPLQIWELSRSQGYVTSPEAFAALGWSWAMTGQTALAVGTIDSALRDSDESAKTPLLRMLAAIHAQRGDFGKSEETWLDALQRNPDDIQSLFGLASARLSDGRPDGVGEVLDRLAELGVAPEKLFPFRTQLLLVAGKPEEAAAQAELRFRENLNDPESAFALFTALVHVHSAVADERRPEIRRRLNDLAGRLCETAAARTRQGAIAKASLFMMDKDWRSARDEFDLADKSAPGDPSIIEQLLRLDYVLNDSGAAGRHARELLRLVPDHGFGNYILGSLALRAASVSSAVAFLERSAAAWESPLPRGDLAYAKYLLGDISSALKLADEALSMRGDLYNVMDTRGLALLAMGRNDEAVEAFEEAIRINSNDPVIHLHLARARFVVGDRDAATEILDAAERIDTRFRNEDLAFYNELRADLRGRK